MEPGTIENLIDFAMDRYMIFDLFSRDQVRKFFEIHQDTTAIKKKDGKILGFIVWEYRGADAIEILGTAAIGSKIENILIFWELWEIAKMYYPGKRIFWKTKDGKVRELECRR